MQVICVLKPVDCFNARAWIQIFKGWFMLLRLIDVKPTAYLHRALCVPVNPYAVPWHVPPQKCNYMSRQRRLRGLWLVCLVPTYLRYCEINSGRLPLPRNGTQYTMDQVEECLIEEVRKYEHLYNWSLPHYKDCQMANNSSTRGTDNHWGKEHIPLLLWWWIAPRQNTSWWRDAELWKVHDPVGTLA